MKMHSEDLIQSDVASFTQKKDNQADREDDRRDERYEQEEWWACGQMEWIQRLRDYARGVYIRPKEREWTVLN
jgi:hypothetical protein